VQLIAALLHEPDLLVLDEPFAGLDPVNMRLLRDLILAEHRRGATILFSTHVMVHAEEICEHVVMIHRGRKVLDDSLASIRRRHDPRTIHFEPLDSGADPAALRAVPGVEAVTRNGNGYRVDLIEGSDPARAMREITAMIPSARVELDRPTLEDVFLRIVAGEGARQTRQEWSSEIRG
jgi:ABC-2 type transport system ATP-binding protein